MGRRLEELATTEDAGEDRPRHGPSWQAAIDAGIDVTLLERSARLAPYDRLRRLVAHLRFAESVQARRLSPEVRGRLEQQRLDEKLAAWGLRRDEVLGGADGDGH